MGKVRGKKLYEGIHRNQVFDWFLFTYVIENLEVVSNDSLDIDWDGLNLERK